MTGKGKAIQGSAVLALAALAACAGRQQEAAAAAAACEAVEGPLPADVVATSMEGTFHLVMVATTGDSVGRVAEGRLELHPNDSTLVRVRYPGLGDFPDITSPLYGSGEIALSQVDAFQPSALDSADPLAPGVLVFVRRAADAAPRITLRFGALANRRDAEPMFDGGYTALRVSWMTDTAFGGAWESAVPNRLHSAGHFCAYAVP